LSADAPSRTITVVLNVPQEAEHLSFGCYSKNSEFRVSKVQFQVIDNVGTQDALQSTIKDATEAVPYNVMVVPSYKIRKSPIEINFEKFIPKAVAIDCT